MRHVFSLPDPNGSSSHPDGVCLFVCPLSYALSLMSCRCEDDLTHKLVEIIRANIQLKRMITNGSPQHILNEYVSLLQVRETSSSSSSNSPSGAWWWCPHAPRGDCSLQGACLQRACWQLRCPQKAWSLYSQPSTQILSIHACLVPLLLPHAVPCGHLHGQHPAGGRGSNAAQWAPHQVHQPGK